MEWNIEALMLGIDKEETMHVSDTYDVEKISAKVHEQWMESKLAKGVTTRKSESGEELMVPYEQLSEGAKDLDRGSVKAVLAAIAAS
jgi:RyR domain-containing protein